MTVTREPTPSRKIAGLVARCCHVNPLDLTPRFSYRTLLGLPLLLAAAYFVPLLSGTNAYLLPSNDLLKWIVLPSLVVVAAAALVLVLLSAARRWIEPHIALCGAVLGLSVFAVIAVNVIFLAAGYNRWEQLIPTRGYLPLELRLYLYKYGFLFGVVAAVWATRGTLRRWSGLLSSLGLALGVLAAVRIFMMWSAHQPMTVWSTGVPASKSVLMNPVAAGTHSRRVVWVIFDESDYERMYGAEASAVAAELTNFTRLESRAVFATSANSPAGATLYSIPALLVGVPIGGDGVRIDRSASLSLEATDGTSIPFGEATTIFGKLAASGRAASILGFYHPYCKLFELQRCDSFPWPQVGGLAVAFWAALPDFLSTKISSAYFGDITENLVRLLPEYLARQDALTFVHLNIPHLPATYADNVLHLPASPNLLTEYSRNLIVTDQILGRIMQTLQNQSPQQDVLLVVSTDHWLRKWSYGDPGQEVSRRVPLIVWKVGATEGVVLAHPVSTVHTGAMILDYLDGKISSQSEIARWWEDKAVYPSFMVPME